MQKLAQTQGALTAALGRFTAVAEQYPDLKASQNMMQLTEELTSTENRVAFARQAYNDSVMTYNNRRQSFPGSVHRRHVPLRRGGPVGDRPGPPRGAGRAEGPILTAPSAGELLRTATRRPRHHVAARAAVRHRGVRHRRRGRRASCSCVNRPRSLSSLAGLLIFVTVVTVLIITGGTVSKTIALRSGGSAVALSVGAVPVDLTTSDPNLRRYVNVVEEMSLASGVPVPRLFVLETRARHQRVRRRLHPGRRRDHGHRRRAARSSTATSCRG